MILIDKLCLYLFACAPLPLLSSIIRLSSIMSSSFSTQYYTSRWLAAAWTLYLVYMFRHFKTTFAVHHPFEGGLTRSLGHFFRHPIGNAPYGTRICPFGRIAVLGLVGCIWVRTCVARSGGDVRPFSWIMLGGTAALSLLNLNAMLYLAPYFVLEVGALAVAAGASTPKKNPA